MKAFPPTLRQFLTEESHVRARIQTLDERAKELEPQIESRKSTQTSVDFLLAVAKRPRPATRELSVLETELSGIVSARAPLAKAAEALAAEILTLTEQYVRGTDETYVRALTAFQDTAAWDAAVLRFPPKLALFLNSVGDIRAMVSVNYDREANKISTVAETAIARGVESALLLEEEITYMNALIEHMVADYGDSPCRNAIPQKLPVVPYAQWTRDLRSLSIVELQPEFARMIGYCEEITRTGLPALAQALPAARAQSVTLCRDYIISYVGTLRGFSDSHWYKAADGDRIIQDLEKRLGQKIARGSSPESHAGGASTNPEGKAAAVA